MVNAVRHRSELKQQLLYNANYTGKWSIVSSQSCDGSVAILEFWAD